MWAYIATFAAGFGLGLVTKQVLLPRLVLLLQRHSLMARPGPYHYVSASDAPESPLVCDEVWQFNETQNVHNMSLPLITWWQDMHPSHSRRLSAAYSQGFRGEVELTDADGYVAWTVDLGAMTQESWNGRGREVRRIRILS